MKLKRCSMWIVLLTLVAAGAFAQATTGNLTGTVSQSGANLPGVTVTIASAAMQGTRTTVTNENGDYNFASIPPGTYKVTFSLSGLTDVTKTAQVNLVGTTRVDAVMSMAAVSQAITVTASQATVMETPQVETNMKQATVQRLPMNRNPVAVAALAPGVTSGINGNSISGAMSYDNLYIVNGAVVQENLRGQPHALYIEDAIQETTTLTGGVSAEFGRFTGGVVSVLTKSGGNQFSGSFRDSFDNPKWTAKSVPTQADPVNKTNSTYEETLGGRIVRDRLWFFVAGRQAKSTQNRNLTAISSLPSTAFNYNVQQSNPRLEAKLTGNLTQKHTLVASYLRNNLRADQNCQLGCLDLRNLNTHGIANPNNFKTLHYNGVITNNFLLEGDWAKKYFAFVGFGGFTPAHQPNPTPEYLAEGTPGADQVVTGAFFNAPYFCGSCGPETRNNKEWEVKGRYFLGTKSLGTHNMVLGYDDWAEQRVSNNYQSPTDFRFDSRVNPPKQMPDGTVQIALKGDPNGRGDRFIYFPVALASLGSDLKTTSAFLNDKWDFNPHFSFNLGARYDKNHAIDSAGHVVSRDSAVSPRLGVIFDTFGNGLLRFDANYSVYTGRLAETVAGLGSAAGNPAVIRFAYAGPDTGYLDSREAIRQAFAWFLANGGLNRAIISQSIPGFNTRLVDAGIQSPDVREITVGVGTNIGKGYFRTDYINRDWRHFYTTFNSLAIGTVANPALPAGSVPADLNLVGTSNIPTRKYWGVQFQGQYQLPLGIGVGGNYTYSKLRGNYEGESGGGGPGTFSGTTTSYPEFQGFAQNAPVGYLSADQRHKFRAWGSYDLPTPIGHLSFGLIERIDSGSPFSTSSSIVSCATNASGACVPLSQPTSPAAPASGSVYPNGTAVPSDPAHRYFNFPTTVTYFFSPRGANRWDYVRATDLALTYELPVHGVGLYAKGEVRNAFNRHAVVSGNTTVYTAANAPRSLYPAGTFATFNPFTQTPIECPRGNTPDQCKAMGANYQVGSQFGKSNGTPTTFSQNGNYQLPRTYLYSVGVRF